MSGFESIPRPKLEHEARGRRPLCVQVVERDTASRALLTHWLRGAGFTVHEGEGDGSAELACVEWSLTSGGTDPLAALRSRLPELPILALASPGDAETALEAIRAGANDCLPRPFDQGRLLGAVSRLVQQRAPRGPLPPKAEPSPAVVSLLGESSAMQEVLIQIERVVHRDVAVILEGEAGSGLELVAAAIHGQSSRSGGPFLSLDCSVLDAREHEAELFGRELESGRAVPGLFEQCNGGVLFLCNVDSLSPAAQSGLSNFLSNSRLRRADGRLSTPLSVRVIASTQRDLRALVQNGSFREDLYFRLVVYPIAVPPLRKRVQDIPLLVRELLRELGRELGFPETCDMHPDALDVLMSYKWPGNVQELQNIVQRSLLTSDGEFIQVSDLPPEVRASGLLREAANENGPSWLFGTEIVPLREIERRAIEHALRLTGGSVALAAKKLGIGRATLYRRIASLELGVEVA